MRNAPDRRQFLATATGAAALAIASLAIPAAAVAAPPVLPDPALTPAQRGEDWGSLDDVFFEACSELQGTAAIRPPLAHRLGLEVVELFAQMHGAAPVADETIARVSSLLELQAIKLLALRDDLHATAAAAGRPIGATTEARV